MRFLFTILMLLSGLTSIVHSQTLLLNKEFGLGSPYSEPDGRNDIVRISETDFITLAKVKGNQSGKSEFSLERYNHELNSVWKVSLSVETYEDYKDLYYNGKDLVLLSVIHNETEKKTKMEAYGFDISNGSRIWTKELESFEVGDWEMHPHKGKVKETFLDVVCEHANHNFVTPFEYKHNVHFSPDNKKFVSYVFNYGEKNLTASVSVYDSQCNLLSRGKVGIDNDFVNNGIYVDNEGLVYLINVNSFGKVNFIRYSLVTKDFDIIEFPGSNHQKDDFHISFQNDGIYIANLELSHEKLTGVKYTKCNFTDKSVDMIIYEELTDDMKNVITKERKRNKDLKGDENWMDYDLTHFIVNPDKSVMIALEKRDLYADGYPHIKKDAFDKSHNVEILGHVQTEGIILYSFNKDGDKQWSSYLAKNQVYPANDGLNTISFVLDNSPKDHIRILYASTEGMDAAPHSINMVSFDRKSGKIVKNIVLPNQDKLVLVRDYTLFLDESNIVLVGKKGLLGKSSSIAKFKL